MSDFINGVLQPVSTKPFLCACFSNAWALRRTVFNAVLDALRDHGHEKKHLSPSEHISAIIWGHVLPRIRGEPYLRQLPFWCVACCVSLLVWTQRLLAQRAHGIPFGGRALPS